MSSDAYVQAELKPALPPPRRTTGALLWIRKNLFGSVTDGILTIIAVLLLASIIPGAYEFLIGKAVFTDPEGIGSLGSGVLFIEPIDSLTFT